MKPVNMSTGKSARQDATELSSAVKQQPSLSMGEVASLEVADIHPRRGCFLETVQGRNILMPLRELPESESLWPEAGDMVYVMMSYDKHGRMIARAAREADLEPLAMPAPTSWKNRWLEVHVYNPLPMGTFVVCKDEEDVCGFGAIGMIHANERTRPLRMGEQLQARVTFVREDGRVNLSMRPLKEHGRDLDAERIIAWLRERPDGAIPYSDQSPADAIQSKFNISKSAFKRALGKLMKEGLVVQDGNWTRLRTKQPEESTPRENE